MAFKNIFFFTQVLLLTSNINAAIIQHDFSFQMSGGGGTGHPAILDEGFPWLGTLTYDTDHMYATDVGGGYTDYSFDPGHAELVLDLNGVEIRLDEVSFNESLSQGQLQIGAKMTDDFVILPHLPSDRYNVDYWLMTQFDFSGVWYIENRLLAPTAKISRNGSTVSGFTTNGLSSFGDYWGWNPHGGTTLSTASEIQAVPIPSAIWLFVSGLLGLICSSRFNHTTNRST